MDGKHNLHVPAKTPSAIFRRRPRLQNLLHAVRLATPDSQTAQVELEALKAHASRARIAIEIGTYQGVSAAIIAKALQPGGVLHCVDSWPEHFGRPNPCRLIAMRHFQRTNVTTQIKIHHGNSSQMQASLPQRCDFAFIDGDHSWEGIDSDWRLLSPRITPGGLVCLHDAVVPESEPRRIHDSCRYYNDIISSNNRFRLLETVHSMVVLRRE
jgi:predicted O-methyltransferase YrrM